MRFFLWVDCKPFFFFFGFGMGFVVVFGVPSGGFRWYWWDVGVIAGDAWVLFCFVVNTAFCTHYDSSP